MAKIKVLRKEEIKEEIVKPGNVVMVGKTPVLVHTDYHPNFRGVAFLANGQLTEEVFSKSVAKPWFGTITIAQE